jgi:uncharacterized protein YyaL (SSP411 family)
MDNAEPSTNGLSAQNLFRLGSLLADESYTASAKSTVQAFEAELLQHPFLFASMLVPVVESRLGVRGVVVVGQSQAGKQWLRAYRGRVSVGETVVNLDSKDGGKKEGAAWLRQRNPLLRDLKGEKILVCEGTTCKELDLEEGAAAAEGAAADTKGRGEKGLDLGRVKAALDEI